MKIAFFVSAFPCLSETFILNQITGLIDRGHDIDIYAEWPDNNPKIHEDVKKYNLLSRTIYFHNPVPGNKLLRIRKAINFLLKNIIKSPEPLLESLNIFKYGREAISLSVFYKIMPFLNRGQYDIIHCQFGQNGNSAVLLKRMGVLKGKIITTFHGYDIRLGIEKGGSIYRELFLEGDLFLAISDYNYRNLMGFGIDERKIIFHPVGIDLNRFPWKWNSGSDLKMGKVRLISVGRLVKEKGHNYGIMAIHKVLQRRPELDLEYVIVGDGPLQEELIRLIENLNLVGVVRLFGSGDQSKVITEIKKSDIYLLPSVAEALPLVAMEAQAIGLPIIASDVGSVDQIVLNGKSGFLVSPMDPDALANKLDYLLDHPNIWADMGLIGKNHVDNKYDINKLNDRLVEIYQQLLNI